MKQRLWVVGGSIGVAIFFLLIGFSTNVYAHPKYKEIFIKNEFSKISNNINIIKTCLGDDIWYPGYYLLAIISYLLVLIIGYLVFPS